MPINPHLRQPFSVLVVIYKRNKDCLLIQRTDDANFWQSVTGGIDKGETPAMTAQRELLEETGINAPALGLTIYDHNKTNQYEIRSAWLHRYEKHAHINTEHVFSICVPDDIKVTLDPSEHTNYLWLSQQDAAKKAWSPSNKEAILLL